MLIVAGAGCEGRGGVTRCRAHNAHIALRANCSPAAAGLHEMAGHSETKYKTEIRRDSFNSFLRDECFIQPIICFEKITAIMLILSPSFVSLWVFILSSLPSDLHKIKYVSFIKVVLKRFISNYAL